MEIFEIKIDLKLHRPVRFKESIEFLSRNVNRIVYHSMLLRLLHENKSFKPYVIGSLGKSDPDRTYHPNKTYRLTIRSIDDGFVAEFVKAACMVKDLEFEIENVDAKMLFLRPIDKLYTITPAVLTVTRNRYWTNEDDLMLLVNNVKENLLKKYRYFFKRDIHPPQDFINFYRIENQKAIVFDYKGGKIFANRFTFGFAPDPASQKLAKLAYGVGILEKNALGFGMVVRGKNDR